MGKKDKFEPREVYYTYSLHFKKLKKVDNDVYVDKAKQFLVDTMTLSQEEVDAVNAHEVEIHGDDVKISFVVDVNN